MCKIDRMKELFQSDFGTNDLFSSGITKGFYCPHQQQCDVYPKRNPIWSPLFGDNDTNVMVVAEAPSSAGGNGIHIAGRVTENNKELFFNQSLLNFITKYYNTIPYFTDVMKCGLPKQTRSNKAKYFKKRIKYCATRYLHREVEILSPNTILCIGNTAFDALKDIDITRSIEVIQLVHYSRQANLPLSDLDKEMVIWPYQSGKVPTSELSRLSFFEKKKKRAT